MNVFLKNWGKNKNFKIVFTFGKKIKKNLIIIYKKGELYFKF